MKPYRKDERGKRFKWKTELDLPSKLRKSVAHGKVMERGKKRHKDKRDLEKQYNF